jgi:uncharacterized membrane protein YphA (DoxX/SURF4 family)
MTVEMATVEIGQETCAERWSMLHRVAFRFVVFYFGLFCVYTQIASALISIPKMELGDPSAHWPMRQIVFWIAAHVFHAKLPLIYTDSGSGDKTFDWVLAFFLLVFSLFATAVWSFADRRRENYIVLEKWFRVFIRFALASQLIGYGIVKVIPLQMPFPFLPKLVEPYGNFSPMGVLWSSIGATPAYETFAGSAELLGGILLIFPRTTMLGALVAMADMTQVFMLNMTYDVPVKLFSFHLLLMSLFLLAPDCARLLNFLVRDRAPEPATRPALFRSRRANRIALAVQIIFGLWMVGTTLYGAMDGRREYGAGRQKSALYGIWNIDMMSIDGQERSPLLNDYQRWRRAIFDFPQSVTFQRMDDSFVYYGTTINTTDQTVTFTKGGDKNVKGKFTFQRPTSDQLVFEGQLDNHKMEMKLRLQDREKFLLVNRGFHWVQEYPFNR